MGICARDTEYKTLLDNDDNDLSSLQDGNSNNLPAELIIMSEIVFWTEKICSHAFVSLLSLTVLFGKLLYHIRLDHSTWNFKYKIQPPSVEVVIICMLSQHIICMWQHTNYVCMLVIIIFFNHVKIIIFGIYIF